MQWESKGFPEDPQCTLEMIHYCGPINCSPYKKKQLIIIERDKASDGMARFYLRGKQFNYAKLICVYTFFSFLPH